MNEKIFLSYIPIEVVKVAHAYFEFKDLGITIGQENWPINLFYNPDLLEGKTMLYDEFYTENTFNSLLLYIGKALRKCKSLVSRALDKPKIILEHGPIRILEIPGDEKKGYVNNSRILLPIGDKK